MNTSLNCQRGSVRLELTVFLSKYDCHCGVWDSIKNQMF